MKIGCDIAKINRFENVKEVFLIRYFTKSEIEYFNSKAKNQKIQTMTGMFCAKEAFLKACGVGMGNGIALLDIEISHDENGKPLIKYLGDLEPIKAMTFEVSISHDGDTAMAICASASDQT